MEIQTILEIYLKETLGIFPKNYSTMITGTLVFLDNLIFDAL
jgi:hypothetical protein